jgi:hypothetical protein
MGISWGPGGGSLQLQAEVGGQARGDVLVGIMAEHCGGGMDQATQPLGGAQGPVFLGKAQADTEDNHGADDQRRLAVAAQQGEGSHGCQQGHQRIAEGGQQLPEPGNRLLPGDLIGAQPGQAQLGLQAAEAIGAAVEPGQQLLGVLPGRLQQVGFSWWCRLAGLCWLGRAPRVPNKSQCHGPGPQLCAPKDFLSDAQI